MRRLIGLIGFTAIGALAIFPSSALAASYSFSAFSSSTGSATSNVGAKSISLSANMSVTDVSSTGQCLDVFFDWDTGGDHYDARIVRQCNPGGVSRSSWNDNWVGRTIGGDGTNKVGRCTVAGVASTGYGGTQSCTYQVNLESNSVGNCNSTVKFTACYTKKGAVTNYWNGGDPRLPNS